MDQTPLEDMKPLLTDQVKVLLFRDKQDIFSKKHQKHQYEPSTLVTNDET